MEELHEEYILVHKGTIVSSHKNSWYLSKSSQVLTAQ